MHTKPAAAKQLWKEQVLRAAGNGEVSNIAIWNERLVLSMEEGQNCDDTNA